MSYSAIVLTLNLPWSRFAVLSTGLSVKAGLSIGELVNGTKIKSQRLTMSVIDII